MAQYDATATVGGNFEPLKSAWLKTKKSIESGKIEPSLSLGKITTDFTKFEQSLDAATARVVAFTATTSLLYGVGSAFKRLTQDAIQIESVMARIQSIFGSTAAETKQFQSAIFGLANDVGLSFFQVAEAAEEFSRQGLSLNKTLEATRAAAVVAKLSGAELKGVIEGLTATLSTFNDGTLDYIQVANKLVALDSAFATSAAGITEGLKRVSGVAVQAGLSFDETAAAITSLKQVTGRSEAVIGNSLKSIFTSLQTEKVQKDLATLGVETKDASGEFRNLVDVLSDLSKVYGTLGDAQKTVIAQRIGKTYQANAFQGILRTFETGDYEKALTTSKNAGSSAEDRLEKLNQTTQSALQRFSNNITQLGGNLGEKLGKPLLDTVVGYMNSAIDAGNKIFGGSGLGDALVGGLKNVLEGPGIVILTFSVAKLLTRIIKESGQAIKSIAGLSGAKENILRIDQFITSNLSEQNKVELERIKTLTSVAAQQKAILNLMNRQLVTQEKMRSQGVLPSLGVIALQSLGPAAASKAAKKIPNRGKGELPEINKAILREAIDIKNGVGGARITASPMVKTLNLGKGPEKVVVNSDEKIVKNFAGSGQDAVLNREMMGFAGGSLPKKIIGYHGTSMEFGGKIDPTRSMGESQGQGFYIFKRKSDAVSHAKNFLQDEPGRKKLIAGRFPTSKLVPDYEVHTPQAVSFLRNNPQLLQGVDTPIGRKGFRLIGGTADKTGVSFIQKSPFSDASIRKRLNLGTTGDVGTGMMLGPLFDSLRSGPNSKLIRQFEESLINSRKGRAFRYIGGETKAYSKNISSGYMPSFDGSGQDAVLNREMMSLSKGSIPSLAKSNVYLYDGERQGDVSDSRVKGFKRAGFNLVDVNNIERIASENIRSGVRPILLDPTLRALDDIPESVKKGFTILSATNVPLDKFQEASLGGLSKSISLPPDFNPRSRNAINSIIETGRREFGGDNFFIKGKIGAQSNAVHTPGSLYYQGDKTRKTVPKGLLDSGGIFLQEGLKNIKQGSEFRVNAIKIGNSVKTFGKTATKNGGEAFGSDEKAGGFLSRAVNKGFLNTISETLSKKIAETQVKNSLKKLKGYSGSIAGADVAETGTSGIFSKALQLIGEKTGLNIGAKGGGVIEYNFSQIASSLYQGGNSGALRREDVILGAGKALQKASKKNIKEFLKRGKEIKGIGDEAGQNTAFKSFYKDLLTFKKYDEGGYLKSVKGLGKLGFGVTAGRGASKRFISYKSLAGGFLPIAKALNKEALSIRGSGAYPKTATIDGRPAVINSGESIVGNSVVPNYARGKKSSRRSKIDRFPSPSNTPISPIREIKAPVPPPEKTGTRPSVDVRGNSLFGDAAKRASAEAQLNKNRERADRISNLIDSKKGLSQNAKQFVSANRGLFAESSLSNFDKRNRSFGQRIGGIGSKISNGVKNFNPGTAAGAGFAISFIGGSVAEGFKTKQGEDTQSSRGIGGVAQGVGIGAQLALFGKTAGIVGLVAGAAVGLNTAFGENLDRLNGLKEKHDGLIKTYREEGESISLFSSSFQDLNDALDSGSEKAAKFAKEGIKKALEGISDEGLKNALVSAKTQEDVSRVVSENQNRRNEALSLSESKVNIGDLLQSNRQGFFGGLVRKNTDSFGSFLGLNEGLNVGAIEKIASSLAGSIDVSKFNEKQRKVYSEKGVSASALPPEVQAALREVESRFSGGSAKILSEISKKLIPKLTDNTSIIGDLEKKARKEQDFTNLISGSAQKANFSSFEKLIKSSLASSLSEISLQGAKPFTSEIAFAESQFAVDKSRRSQDLASKSAGLNASLIEKAQELTKGRNLDFAQLGKIQGAFSKFGETQDVGAFLKDFEGIIGTDSKELVKFAQGQFLELKKLSAETAAGNQEADARQRTLIEELKRGQRATLFGGGLNKFDRGQANPGLVETLRGPKYNKFNDPTRPGFGLDEKTGRKTFSLGEYAQEESKILDANENRYDKIIQRAQYLKESGYFGVEPTADTPENLKDQRQKLLEQERKPLVEALIGKRQKFAKDLALSESGSYVSAINADSKRITGGVAITTEQKKVIADAIKSGSYDTAIGALDESTKNLTKDYGFSGKSDELGKIDAFRTFLQQQKENASNISLAAEEQAKNILPDQTLEGQNIQLLTEIKDEGVKTNENLSKLAELMSQIQTKDLNLSKTTAVGEGISELSSLEMKLAEKNSPLEFDKLKKDLEFDIKRGAIEGNPLDPSVLSNFGGDGSSVSPESLGNYFKYKNKYENPSALEKIYSNRIGRFTDQKSIDRDLESIKSKASGTSKIKDELEKSNVLDSLIESIKGLKDELGKRLDSGKTSKIDQNINLDINATVAGTNVLASEDFKNSLTAFVGSYVKNVWKENTGNIMIEPPSKNSATA